MFVISKRVKLKARKAEVIILDFLVIFSSFPTYFTNACFQLAISFCFCLPVSFSRALGNWRPLVARQNVFSEGKFMFLYLHIIIADEKWGERAFLSCSRLLPESNPGEIAPKKLFRFKK